MCALKAPEHVSVYYTKREKFPAVVDEFSIIYCHCLLKDKTEDVSILSDERKKSWFNNNTYHT